MANATSANLKLTVQTTGENSGTWGQITNTNLLILEQAIGGCAGVGLNATTGATLSTPSTIADISKSLIPLRIEPTPLTHVKMWLAFIS